MFHIYTDAKAEIRHVWGPKVHERTKKGGNSHYAWLPDSH
jgi:hypothetical protein